MKPLDTDTVHDISIAFQAVDVKQQTMFSAAASLEGSITCLDRCGCSRNECKLSNNMVFLISHR